MVPLDERAADEVRASGGSELAAWLASVGGAKRPRRHTLHELFSSNPAGSGLSTPLVAQAVDQGRDTTRADADRGITVVAACANVDASRLARWLLGEAPDPEIRGPLGALLRLGSFQLAQVTGLALGAGEHGLGFVCGDLAATAAAGIAIAVEPDLRPRVRAADRTNAVLLERLGIEPVVESGGLPAALSALANA